jgi:cytochrome b561
MPQAGTALQSGEWNGIAPEWFRVFYGASASSYLYRPHFMAESSRYSTIAIALHWIIAVLMVVNVVLGLSGDAVPDSWARPVIDTHKSIGITVLGLAILRLLWRWSHPAPPLPAAYPRWERIAAHVAHALLYVLIFTLPITGWMHDSAWKDAPTHPMKLFGLVPWPRLGWILSTEPVRKEQLHDLYFGWHVALAYALCVLFALHLVAALKHQFRDRHPELQRMGLGKTRDDA